MRYHSTESVTLRLYPTPRGGWAVYRPGPDGIWRGWWPAPAIPEGDYIEVPTMRAWSGTQNDPGGDPRYNIPRRIEVSNELKLIAHIWNSNSKVDFLVEQLPAELAGMQFDGHGGWNPPKEVITLTV